MAEHHSKVAIIGSGPAGYAAAIYTSRALLEPTLIAGMEQGGQLMITTDVENYPGYADTVQGPWMMEQMLAQAKNVGTNMVSDIVTSVDTTSTPFRMTTESGDIYTCDALIVATGAQAKWLGLESEQKFQGFGVSACATCDGFFYKGQNVIVVGGGNTAVEEALYLSNLAAKVYVVHRRDELRSERILQQRLFAKDNVEMLWDSELAEVTGTEGLVSSVTGAKIRNVKSGDITEMPIDGIFIAIGHAPAVELFVGKLKQKPNGYLWTAADSTKTDVPGIFAAGDVTDDIYRQAVTAAGLGCMAALEAEKYLAVTVVLAEAAE